MLAYVLAPVTAHSEFRAARSADRPASGAVRKARCPFLRTMEEFNFTFQTALRLQMLGSYLGPELVSQGRTRSSAARMGRENRTSALRLRTVPFSMATRRASSGRMSSSGNSRGRPPKGAQRLRSHLISTRTSLIVDELGYLSHAADAAKCSIA